MSAGPGLYELRLVAQSPTAVLSYELYAVVQSGGAEGVCYLPGSFPEGR
ncbi:MAG TPA: hypothetical protein VI796_00840 [Candidatus Thermoplasmatota archaeon]|nr:hypothetical protein [Candidatus Thermoplasmatota archaeon]